MTRRTANRLILSFLIVAIAINWWLGDEPITTGLSAAECPTGCYILPVGGEL